jgi:hypothetical protein
LARAVPAQVALRGGELLQIGVQTHFEIGVRQVLAVAGQDSPALKVHPNHGAVRLLRVHVDEFEQGVASGAQAIDFVVLHHAVFASGGILEEELRLGGLAGDHVIGLERHRDSRPAAPGAMLTVHMDSGRPGKVINFPPYPESGPHGNTSP